MASGIPNMWSFWTPYPQITWYGACSLILSRLDYCNAVLHGAPAGSIQKLQRVQNTTARVVLRVPKRTSAQPLLKQLHWLPVRQRIDYKLAVLTCKIRSTSTPSYLSRHIRLWGSARHFRSSAVPLLYKPTTRTRFADRAFRCTAPTVWNSLAIDVTSSCSLTVFKSRLKSHIFRQTFNLSD